jgi:hypothetical protein
MTFPTFNFMDLYKNSLGISTLKNILFLISFMPRSPLGVFMEHGICSVSGNCTALEIGKKWAQGVSSPLPLRSVEQVSLPSVNFLINEISNLIKYSIRSLIALKLYASVILNYYKHKF